MSTNCYAIYKGDKFIDLGTLQELSEKLNVKPNTIYFYSTPTYRKRSKGKYGNKLIVIKVGNVYEN